MKMERMKVFYQSNQLCEFCMHNTKSINWMIKTIDQKHS